MVLVEVILQDVVQMVRMPGLVEVLALLLEGGQTPLFRRLPKRGFNNVFKKEYNEINLYQLNRFSENEVVTIEKLQELGLVNRPAKDGLKILGDGNVEKALHVQANAFTKSAKEK